MRLLIGSWSLVICISSKPQEEVLCGLGSDKFPSVRLLTSLYLNYFIQVTKLLRNTCVLNSKCLEITAAVLLLKYAVVWVTAWNRHPLGERWRLKVCCGCNGARVYIDLFEEPACKEYL